ncbi:sugar transferase, partial [Staphylococcus aureus]
YITDDEIVADDYYYLTHQSMMLDMYIIYKAIKNIVASEGGDH